MAPALFVGGAALALPPLYMFGTLLGGQSSLSQIVGRLSGTLASVSLALLGLAAPAAYLSVTLRTTLGPLLLVLASIVVGTAGVAAVLRESLDAEPAPRPRAALLGWGAFALALGGRLLWSIARTRGL
jgi:ABC-type transport system involved in multi-copper enzyme maturation permease subunit